MSYKKFLKSVNTVGARLGVSGNNESSYNMYNKAKNFLPLVYQGPANRIERYGIYDGMEQDPIINWSLDIVSDFVSQSGDEPFKIEYESMSELPVTQTTTIEKSLDTWVRLNNWKKRIFAVVREVLKYGDVIFIRDPETNELNKCNIYDVLGVVVDENKNPTHYIIRNVELNVPLQVANNSKNDVATKNLMNTLNGNFQTNTVNNTTTQVTNDPNNDMSIIPVSADYVIHLSLNIDNILLYPFGLSTLESIYKTYVQKMLLQDCILLYRIKNATEKLIFTIPVGNVPKYKRKQFMEKCRNELTQRRMPSKDSDGVFNTIDVAYNAIPFNEDYWLPVDADGVQPKIEKLQGGQALGEINDMVYWENQLIRGLKVPQSWIPYGPTDGQRTTATNTSNTYVQELRFFKYCTRLQKTLIGYLDKEFKYYMKKQGINVDETSFSLSFFEPTNITDITKMEIEQSRLNLFSAASGSPYISKQFALKTYLGLTEEEYNENQRLLMLENQNTFKDKDIQLPTEDSKQVPGLRTVGMEDIPMDYLNDMTNELESGMNNMGGMVPSGGVGGDLGGGIGGDIGMPDGGLGGLGGDLGQSGSTMGGMPSNNMNSGV